MSCLRMRRKPHPHNSVTYHVKVSVCIYRGSTLLDTERSKVFSLLLHMCDISHPGKPWHMHKEWSVRLAEEFYRQGDREKSLALPLSPLCDRNNGNLPTSQIGEPFQATTVS